MADQEVLYGLLPNVCLRGGNYTNQIMVNNIQSETGKIMTNPYLKS